MKADVNTIKLNYGDAELAFFNINLASASDGTPVWHRHSYYEVHVCRCAGAEYTFEDKTVTLCEGQLLVIPPDTLHLSVDRESYSDESIFVLSFDIKEAKGDKGFFRAFTGALKACATLPLSVGRIARLNFAPFCDRSAYRTVRGVCRLKAAAAEFVSLLFEATVSDAEDTLYGKQETAILIDNMINTPTVTLDEIAKATNYSKRHVSRLIKAKYGVSLGALKRQSRKGKSHER